PAGLGFYPLKLQPQPLVNPEQAEVSITVAGDEKLEVDGDDVKVDGRTVRWAGTLDVEREIAMTAGEVEGGLPTG
ncbi:MAG TPA: hypothetical protein VGO78_23360, partial [Acidimicrobiales bacterium]|nr:hypothetical protein [Acidimicrobiales bacterium]